MDLFGALRAFVMVVDDGGFARAARRSGLATSSVTRQVDALEAHLGTSLLNRSTRSVTLTPAGEDYLRQVVGLWYAGPHGLIGMSRIRARGVMKGSVETGIVHGA